MLLQSLSFDLYLIKIKVSNNACKVVIGVTFLIRYLLLILNSIAVNIKKCLIFTWCLKKTQ